MNCPSLSILYLVTLFTYLFKYVIKDRYCKNTIRISLQIMQFVTRVQTLDRFQATLLRNTLVLFIYN